MRNEMKINKVYHVQLWHYLFFKVSSLKKLTSIFASFSSTHFKYILLSHLYNIFAIYFPGNSSLLKSLSFAKSSFSYHLTFAFILSSNSIIASFTFYKSSFSKCHFLLWTPFIVPDTWILPLFFFDLIFFLPSILQLHLPLLVLLLPIFVSLFVSYTTLLN